MKRVLVISLCVCFISGVASADIFGGGANEFTIDFVNISGDSGDLGSWSAGSDYTFTGVNHGDYRMGTYEITNDQWDKFKNELGVPVTGSPSNAYDEDPDWEGANIPTNMVSWYEAAQFVNWLNTSTNHLEAYKFSGTQGTSGYTLEVWESGDVGYDPDNPYRNSNAYYFLPTEDEWIKAGYWNGTNLQFLATLDGTLPTAGVDTNYGFTNGEPWDVGSGTEELNGTFDMMGNLWEWMESPYPSGDYTSSFDRGICGGSYYWDINFENHFLSWTTLYGGSPYGESEMLGFRVASVPEPGTVLLLGLGGLVLRRKR